MYKSYSNRDCHTTVKSYFNLSEPLSFHVLPIGLQQNQDTKCT